MPSLRLIALLCAAASLPAQQPTLLSGLPAGAPNAHYAGNRAPLRALPLTKLPVGAVKPGGWVREQMRLMSEGFSGRLPELSQFCQFDNNAWTDSSGQGRFGWEELPYWLKGFIDLGYVMEDKRIIAEATRWVEAVLKTQAPDGYFGPRANLLGINTLANEQNLDIWPHMVMMYVLRTHFEATGDPRVIPFMRRYFQWYMKQPLESILWGSWQKHRGGDNLDHILWLYSQTGERWLLDAARVNHERTSDWTGGIPTWHGVNFSECFREPAQYFQVTGDERYLRATERNYDTMQRIYGQGAGGGNATDENARPGFTGARQGTETCTWVEFMFSHEMLGSITGEGKWLDRADEIAFNSLPASMTPDLKGLHYLTAPNQVQLDRGNKAPLVDNSGDMFSYNPYGYRCCQHNTAMGWSYYAQRAWMATASNGLAAAFYHANSVTAKVGGGAQVTIEETTDYPFGETVSFVVKSAAPVEFPLSLRIPEWCAQPSLKLNGRPVEMVKPEHGWVTLHRLWTSGDRLELTLPMQPRVKRWDGQQHAASVHYGPLNFSLQIAEQWKPYGDDPKWTKYEVLPKSPWNYALESAPMVVQKRPGTTAAQPFTHETAPLLIKARGRRVPEWKLEPNGMTGELQASPVATSEPSEQITLIPAGAARLRITMFPVVSPGEKSVRWDPNPPLVTASNATHFDQPHQPGFAWGGKRGTTEWIERRYAEARAFAWSEAKFASGAEPQSTRLLYLDGKEWREARAGNGAFPAVRSTAVRLEVKMAPRTGARLLEWRASAAKE